MVHLGAMWYRLCYSRPRPTVLVMLCCVLAFLAGQGVASGPRITAKMEAGNKINHTGNQRLLSQELILSVCMVLSNADAAAFAERAWFAADEFEQVLDGLGAGSNDLGLARETNPQILAALGDLRQSWQVLGPATRQIVSGDRHSVPVTQVLQLDAQMRRQAEQAVRLVEQHYGAVALEPDLARAINLISRERMLLAQVAKDACFISINLSRGHSQAEITAAVGQMEQAMALLLEGDAEAGIAAPPNGFIPFSLKKITRKWEKLRPRIDQLARGEALDLAELRSFVQDCKDLSKAVQAVAVLYIKS
jgi:hypothetical protein